MTEKDDIPEHRCGFEVTLDIDTGIRMSPVCCWRQTWRDTDRCVWHAEVKNKPIEELKAARADNPERLDGAYLAEVDAGDGFSFQGCGLKSAVFSDGEFNGAEFQNAYLYLADFHGADLENAQFNYAYLLQTQFHDANLIGTNFQNAFLGYAKFYDARLDYAKFQNASLGETKFHNARLPFAWFHDANLHRAEFHKADFYKTKLHNAVLTKTRFHKAALHETEFHDADLNDAQFHKATLDKTAFHDADLSNADYADADARNADFTQAILHDTLFTRADCRGAIFSNALLYETVFADTRINSQTTFYDSSTSRPAVVYEENSLTSEDLPEDVHPLEAAEWVYRRLEKLHNENALSEDARDFHISKEEAQRKYQRESREYARYAVSTLQWYVTGHGESIPRIFGSAAFLILACGILYPFAGGFESSSTGAAYRIHLPPTEFSRAAILDSIATFLQSIYFSVITFTTIGYGDLYPTGAWSKVLVGFESLSGAILIALFVFVLGRRVAR